MKPVVFRNARVFDGWSDGLRDGCEVVVADGVIQSAGEGQGAVPRDAEVVDCRGRVLMPGLIDAHVHVYAAGVDLMRVVGKPPTYLAHFAARFMSASLDRGFTSLRDMGGADVGLASAIADGLVSGPRLFYGGRVMSQTGGHGDTRPGDCDLHAFDSCPCACHADWLCVIADGADAVRKAVREELRRGASHIKIMGSGGVASPTDPLDRCQYSDGEIAAAVEEAQRAGKYVAAHCHPKEAIARCVRLGVRTIEHATLIDEETAALIAEREAFAVPTMATIFALLDQGAALGLPPASQEKLKVVGEHALSGLETMRRAGVKMGLGTDLLGDLHTLQGSEFTLRGRVLPAIEVLRSACAVNAEILDESGRLGCIAPGALADLIVVDGDPLADLAVLDGDGERLDVVMSAGRFHKRTI
ncbi:MAG TPA: amidohydrolase family protein [Caulobacteraceae bacterium]|jgi:imidazolonepropionase-like amidohydrolase|nr:amidohydrolase family protein [Caulobacteraceae bacterium]